MTDTDYAIGYKLTRSIKHLQALERTIKRFLKGKANGVVNDFTSEPGYLIVKAFVRRKPPPSCSGLIGETLYHQRAALDYMACDLARYNDQIVDDHVEFPIFKDGNNFRNPVTGKLTDGIVKRIGLLRPDHRAVIESEQPFQERHGKPEEDPLWLLYRLSNFDRHQFIHLASVITNDSFHTFTPRQASARFQQVRFNYGAFENEAEVARFRIIPGAELDVHVQSDVRFDVAFDANGPGGGRPVLQTLGAIGVRVAEIMERFTPLV